jgi:hypothetical protein
MTRLISVFLFICISMATAVLSAERPQRLSPGNVSATFTAPTILSIVPAQAEPGGKVMIFGSGFGDSARVFLGSVEMPAKTSDGKQIEFSVPAQLQPGLYALYLKRADGATSRPYNFAILSLRPVVSGLSPDQISACAQGREREVTVLGQNFNEKSMLLFDGAGMKSHFISSEAMTFSVPQVAGGLHQVLISNSPGNSSLPMALTIETRPEISQVTMGSEHVNYYELIVDGRNFQQNSSLYVDGQRIGGRGGQEVSEREKLIYLDCTRLIYQRYPYSPVNKDFRIQVLNLGGEASQVVNVTAP